MNQKVSNQNQKANLGPGIQEKENAYMELRSHFLKRVDGAIVAELKVVDSGDYPVTGIFYNSSDWPSKKDFALDYKHGISIEGTFDTPEEAQAWVKQEISSLKDHLQKWRAIIVPDDETFFI